MNFRERFVSRVSPGLKTGTSGWALVQTCGGSRPPDAFRGLLHSVTDTADFFFTYLRCLCSRLSVEKLPVLHWVTVEPKEPAVSYLALYHFPEVRTMTQPIMAQNTSPSLLWLRYLSNLSAEPLRLEGVVLARNCVHKWCLCDLCLPRSPHHHHHHCLLHF